jgi:hypothetical protein
LVYIQTIKKEIFMKTLNFLNAKCIIKHLGSLIALSIVFTFSAGTFAQSANPDFSGKWILNTGKSQLMQVKHAHTLSVEQSNDIISMYLIFTGIEGQDSTTSTFTYNVDGIPSQYSDEYGDEERLTKWSENGRGFSESIEYIDYVYEYYDQSLDEFEISEDLKTLTNTITSNYTIIEVRVYDKAGR